MLGKSTDIVRNILGIVASVKSQSAASSGIDIAVDTFGTGTQKDAAMREQSTAASNGLAK